MTFYFQPYIPRGPLSPYLDQIFYARGRIGYKYDKILPNGKIVVIVSLGSRHKVGKNPQAEHNPLFTHGWISGIQTSPVYNYPLQDTHVMGCIFDPLKFHRLFGLLLSDWVDRTDGLDVFFGKSEIHGLIQSLKSARNDARPNGTPLFEIIEKWLCGYLGQVREIPVWLRQGYDDILSSHGALSLEQLYKRLNISGRHFNTRFQHCVGPSPKTFCRILRLNGLLPELDPLKQETLARIAYRHGYTDQAHFNRDFKHFSGLTPTDYFKQRRTGFGDIAKGQDPLFIPEDG